MKYLVIDSDGQATQTNNEPSQDDLQIVMDGDMQIFRFNAGAFDVVEVSETMKGDDGDETELEIDWISV